MTIYWSAFGPGLALLLFPADRLLSSGVGLRTFDCFNTLENSPGRPWWWVPALWLDPVRAFAGTWLVRHALAFESNKWILAGEPAYWVLFGVIGAAVLCQVATRREEGVLLAPIGFVTGVVAALMSWPVAVLSTALAVAGVFAFRRLHAFFTVGCGAVGLLGLLLSPKVAWLAPAAWALVVPLVAALATGSTLELPVRKATGGAPEPEHRNDRPLA